MAYKWQHWMVDEFRAAGLEVIEVQGWRTRGRPASSGSFDPYALNVHHTGGTSSVSNPTPGLTTLINGRNDLPGPIAHYAVDFLGRVWLIAAGRANVNGANRGTATVPAGDGNRDLMGDEVFTNGTQQMSAAQERAVALTSAVVVRHFHGSNGLAYLYRHEDTSKTGKWDIGQWTTAQLRARTAPFMSGTPSTDWFDMASREDLVSVLRSEGISGAGQYAQQFDAPELAQLAQAVANVLRSEGVSGAGDLGRQRDSLVPAIVAAQENPFDDEAKVAKLADALAARILVATHTDPTEEPTP